MPTLRQPGDTEGGHSNGLKPEHAIELLDRGAIRTIFYPSIRLTTR